MPFEPVYEDRLLPVREPLESNDPVVAPSISDKVFLA